jgi:hypothetical protein
VCGVRGDGEEVALEAGEAPQMGDDELTHAHQVRVDVDGVEESSRAPHLAVTSHLRDTSPCLPLLDNLLLCACIVARF